MYIINILFSTGFIKMFKIKIDILGFCVKNVVFNLFMKSNRVFLANTIFLVMTRLCRKYQFCFVDSDDFDTK